MASEKRQIRVLKAADNLRNAAEEYLEFVRELKRPSKALGSALRDAIAAYDEAMSDAKQEEFDNQ